MTELFINNVSVDLSEDLQHSLNYAIADIREPDKRNTSFSKTITLVGSKETNKLFSHLFEVNVSVNSSGTTNFAPSFNPNLKASAIMFADSIEVFSGYVQLKNIVVLDRYEVEYEIVMYGQLGDLFFNLGVHELTELSLSEYNHTYSVTNIVNSWNVSNVGSCYHYSMIDRGLNDNINWKVSDWKPSVWLKTYIDKIFAYGGFTYSSDFFDSNFFKRLHMPFVGEGFRLTQNAIDQRRFVAVQNSTVNNNNALLGSNVYTTWQFQSETYDLGNNYNTGTYQWVSPANGTYVFSAELIVSLRFVPSSPAYFKGSNGSQSSISGWVDIVKEDSGGNITVISPSVSFTGIDNPFSSLVTGDTTYSPLNIKVATSTTGYYINQGEKVYVRFRTLINRFGSNVFSDASGNNVNGDIYVVTNSGSYFENSIVNIGYAEGETVLMNSAIPTNVKMRDILSSTLKMFNLYAISDNSQQNKLLIIPRNDFYNNETVDWSEKLDLSQPFNIEPMGGLDAKRYEFMWDYDEDYFNKYYKDKYNKVYGNRTIDILNDFVSNVTENKVIWASTIPASDTVSDRITPSILAADGSNKQFTAKPRLLYYGGTRFCDGWNFLGDGGSTTYYQYPYSGHLDDPLNSTVDLNFGVVSELMYTAQTIIYTNNNTYNRFHKQFIEEITDKDSKIVTADFWLTPADILKLSFRKNYFFNESYFRLNKIIDYNPSGEGLTKCEFIKIITATTFESSGIVFNGGTSSDAIGMNEETYPMFITQKREGGTNRTYERGIDNIVSPSAKNIAVIGDYNIIGNDVDGAFLVGSSGNNIQAGLHNVTLINTSGQTISESGVFMVDNNLLSNPIYDYNFSGAQTGADTNLTTLYTYTLPANSLALDDDTLCIEASYSTAANANSKTVSILFDTDSIATKTTTTASDIISFNTKITRRSSGSWSFVTRTMTSSNYVNVEQNAYFSTFSNTINISFRGQNGVASAGDIGLYDVLIYVLRKK